ncbi:hypothetical protein BDV40DRAFT_6012 [Aspergillus tamarii]|uniref:Uncharacterized protein n=1 Tax=Aspergillus tamarii TaxID=41984 RepID=A0A5N6V6Q0_ASPTM|nr:hypothetical protein BDV40DRAFT_6012 [Aspergillus tamarii]
MLPKIMLVYILQFYTLRHPCVSAIFRRLCYRLVLSTLQVYIYELCKCNGVHLLSGTRSTMIYQGFISTGVVSGV